MTIKPFAAGQVRPLQGLTFVWNTIRPQDMVTVGTMSPREAEEVIEMSFGILERRTINSTPGNPLQGLGQAVGQGRQVGFRNLPGRAITPGPQLHGTQRRMASPLGMPFSFTLATGYSSPAPDIGRLTPTAVLSRRNRPPWQTPRRNRLGGPPVAALHRDPVDLPVGG